MNTHNSTIAMNALDELQRQIVWRYIKLNHPALAALLTSSDVTHTMKVFNATVMIDKALVNNALQGLNK